MGGQSDATETRSLPFERRLVLVHMAIEVFEVELSGVCFSLRVEVLLQMAREPSGTNVDAPGVVLTRTKYVHQLRLTDVFIVVPGHLAHPECIVP